MMAHEHESDPAVAERIAAWLAATASDELPAEVVETSRRLFLDVAGLCAAARNEPYVTATLGAVDLGGDCTAIGHRSGERLRPRRAEDGQTGGFDAFGAALMPILGEVGIDPGQPAVMPVHRINQTQQ